MVAKLFFSALFLFSAVTVAQAENKTAFDAALAVQVIRHGDNNSYTVLNDVESLVKDPNSITAKAKLQFTYFAVQPKSDLETPKTDKILSAVTGIDWSDVSEVTLPSNLEPENQKVMFKRLQNLIHVYNNPGADGEAKREVIQEYFDKYMHMDLSQGEAALMADMELMKMSAITDHIDLKLGNVEEQIKKYVKDTASDSVKSLNASIDQAQKNILTHIDQSNADLKMAVESGTAPLLAMSEDLNYLKVREEDRQFQEEIMSVENYEKLSEPLAEQNKLIAQAGGCQNPEPGSSCDRLVKRKEFIQSTQEFNKTRDTRAATIGSLEMVENIATVFGDQKLARDVSRAKFVTQTAFDISDKLSKMNTQSALGMAASMTNVVSMAFTVASVFGGGGDSADAAILAALRQIQESINKLREEMHTRFDNLEKQITQLGIGLNLKLDHTNDNLAILSENQQIITALVQQNSIDIAELASVQSNMQVSEIARELRQLDDKVSSSNEPWQIKEALFDAMTLFSSYIDYSGTLSLAWPKSNFSWRSPKLVQIVNQAHVGLPQANYATFTLVDYLMRMPLLEQEIASKGKSAAPAVCATINMNDLYLFNILGSTYANIFRSDFDENGEVQYSKINKYLWYLNDTKLSPKNTQLLIEKPLNYVDQLVQHANTCLNNYAEVEGKSTHVISYLISAYSQLLKAEFQRIIDNTSNGHHLAALQKSIVDSNQGYFKDLDKSFMAVDSENPAARAMIDLTKVDFNKSYDENLLWAKNLFYEKYKIVEPCPPSAGGYAVKDLQPINIPRGIFENIFNNDKLKLSLVMGLNSLERVCYEPHWVTHPKFRDTPAPAPIAINVFVNSMPLFRIPIFVPDARMKWDWHKVRVSDLSKVNQYEAEPRTILIDEKRLNSSSLISYLNDIFPGVTVDCQNFLGFARTCWSEGVAPDPEYLAYNTGVNNNDFYKNNPDAVKFNKMLASEPIEQVYTAMQQDVQRCMNRLLFGYNQCQFADYKSLESIGGQADFSNANQIGAVLRLLTPVIASFKDNATPKQRREFIRNLDQALVSPQQLMLSAAKSTGNRIDNLLSEIKIAQNDLLKTSDLSSQVLEVDTRELLNTDVYSALKFYSKQTEEAFEAKAAK